MPKKERTPEMAAQQAAYHKKWYERNKEKHKANAKITKYASVERNLAYIRGIKATAGCSRCPENHPACLDFHHLDSNTKSANVSDLAVRAMSIASLDREIAMCEVLCKNCHAKLHDEIGQ